MYLIRDKIMEKRALVVYADENKAELAVKRECACTNSGNCAKSCFSFAENTISVTCANSGGFKKGDIVEIKTNTAAILAYAFFVFILPFIPAAISFALLQFFISSEIVLFIISIAVFAAVFFLDCVIINNYIKIKHNYKIVKVLN